MSRIFVMEDQPLVLDALEREIRLGFIDKTPQVNLFSQLDEGLAFASKTKIEFAIVDLNIRGELSFPLIKKLVEQNTKVVIFSAFEEAFYLKFAIDQQVHGYVSKNSYPSYIIDFLKKPYHTQPYLCPIMEKVFATHRNLLASAKFPFEISATALEMNILKSLYLQHSHDRICTLYNLSRLELESIKENLVRSHHAPIHEIVISYKFLYEEKGLLW